MKQTIKVPQDWEDINVGKYIEFRSTFKEGIGLIDLSLLQVSILCNVDMELCEKMSLESLKKVQLHLNKFLTLPNQIPVTNVIQLIGKTQVGYEPNISKWTAGQYVDYKSVLDRGGKDLLDILHEVLGTIIVPVKDGKLVEYSNETKAEMQDLIYAHLNMRDALGICFFFSRLYETLIEDFKDYTEKKAIKKMREAIRIMK